MGFEFRVDIYESFTDWVYFRKFECLFMARVTVELEVKLGLCLGF